MRVLFLVSDSGWSARARAFVLAARGLAARGHEVMFACETDCPVQLRAAHQAISIVSLQPDASAAGDTWQIRRAVQEHNVDVVFVHTDQEHVVASSGVRLGGGAGAVIRRIPPFAVVTAGAGARFASRLTPSGLLFSTEADRAAYKGNQRVPASVAPLAVDPADHASVAATPKTALGASATARLIVCVHDGVDTHRALVALRTLAYLAPRHPELHLAIVGAGRQDELRMHGAALGVNSMVSYLGAREDELSIMKSADLGWIAADGDAAAFAILDFMALGTAVIAERGPLFEHYIADGITGQLLTRAEPSTTAAAVAAFLTRNEQRAAMGNAGRTRLQREFAYDAMINGFEAAIGGGAERVPQTVG